MIRTYHHGDTTQLAPHFRACEFQCKCGKGHDFQLDGEVVENLEQFFTVVPKLFSVKVKCINVSSGFRCVAHDKSVGGSGTGQHTLGRAADYTIILEDGSTLASWKVCIAAQEIGFRGIARINDGYTHSDTRSGKWYGDETKGSSFCIPCADFYEYFKVAKEAKPMKQGIDISYCQPKVDWSKVTVDFCIIQIGGGYVARKQDTMYESHYAGAKGRGISVGGYWFTQAMNEQEAREEADLCIGMMQGKQFEFPIFLDLEQERQFKLGKAKVSAIIRAWLERVEAAGFWVGLYTNLSALTYYVEDDIKKRYSIWLAQWDVSKPTYQGAYGIWQTGLGSFSGFPDKVDADICYIDYPAQIKAKGLNGYGAPAEQNPAADQKQDSINVKVEIGGAVYEGPLIRTDA